MNETQLEKNIYETIDPVVQDTGFRLVYIEMGQDATTSMPLLRIMCENPETGRINIDECATISREISATLDVEDLIPYAYRLEVSSPGIDRPLVSFDDFKAYIGHDARVWLSIPLENGQKKMRGTIQSVEDETITLLSDSDVFKIEFHKISRAKLVLTDRLIKETAKSFEVSEKSE